jgi:hypothetical protein
MKNFKIIISKAIQEREISAYLKREMKIAESKEFYDPYDFRSDLLLTLSKLEQTENHTFERELNQLNYKISENVITSFVYDNYNRFCIDKNENRTFDDYLKEQYPIRESELQIEILQLTNKHNKIISHYKSVEKAINKITTQFEPEPDQLTIDNSYIFSEDVLNSLSKFDGLLWDKFNRDWFRLKQPTKIKLLKTCTQPMFIYFFDKYLDKELCMNPTEWLPLIFTNHFNYTNQHTEIGVLQHFSNKHTKKSKKFDEFKQKINSLFIPNE